MPTKRVCETALGAVSDVRDGDTRLVHSFGPPQAWPTDLLLALRERNVRDLTVVCNSTAAHPTSVQILAEKRQVRKLVCTFAVLPVGFLLRELAPGFTVDDLRAATAAPLAIASNVGEMRFD